MGTIFALSWLITWFGHVLSDFRHVVRLYDFFLACHPLMPIYFAAVVRVGWNGDRVSHCKVLWGCAEGLAVLVLCCPLCFSSHMGRVSVQCIP